MKSSKSKCQCTIRKKKELSQITEVDDRINRMGNSAEAETDTEEESKMILHVIIKALVEHPNSDE